MECKRDSFNGSLGGASETHWECVSHCLQGSVHFINIEKFFFFFFYFYRKYMYPGSIVCRHRRLTSGKIFPWFFILKNLERVFLKTPFFRMVSTTSSKPVNRFLWNLNHIFFTLIATRWPTTVLKFEFLTFFFAKNRVKKNSYFFVFFVRHIVIY